MAGAAKKFNLTELLNQRSKEAGEQQKTEQQQAAGTEIATPEEGVSSTADIYDLIPSKRQLLQRRGRAGLETVH